MAIIWNDIYLKWKGKEYTVRPTLTFINHLEQRPNHSLSNMIVAAANNKLGTVACAEIVFDTLKYAGADVETVEEVWESFGGVGSGLTGSAHSILTACLPQPKEGEGAKKPAPNPKPQRKSRKPTGAKPTV